MSCPDYDIAALSMQCNEYWLVPVFNLDVRVGLSKQTKTEPVN